MTFQGNQIGGVPRGKRAENLIWRDQEGKFQVRVTIPGSEKYEITKEDARVLATMPE